MASMNAATILRTIDASEVVEQLHDAAALAALDVALRTDDAAMAGRVLLNIKRAYALRIAGDAGAVSVEEASCRAVAGVEVML